MGEQQYVDLALDKVSLENKIENAVEGLPTQVFRKLRSVKNNGNVIIIADYVNAMKTEINLSDNYRACVIKTLSRLSEFHNHTDFSLMTRSDLLSFLDSRRKIESEDWQHRWIGTYNTYRIYLIRFFKWLTNPELPPQDRPKPSSIENIPHLKRKEVSIYKPSDLWTAEDDILFLKYCPSKRDRCYHTISRDTSCRPHEILRLKLKDVVFKIAGNNRQYAEVTLSGKTGQRHVPIINSLPYLKDWIDSHPMPGNPNSPLICGSGRSLGRRMSPNSINRIYHDYEKRFTNLLNDPNVPQADKNAISKLLKKPWNPYIRRHSALTEKAKILKEPILKIHAGWSQGSNMHLKYEHWFGNESSESILEAYGLKPRELEINKLQPIQCPNCGEQNKIDSKFCAKCRMILTYDGFTEVIGEKQNNDDALTTLSDQIMRLTAEVQELKKRYF